MDKLNTLCPGTNIREHIVSLPLRKPINQEFLGLIINEVFTRYGTVKTSAIFDKIKDQGFHYSTKAVLLFHSTILPQLKVKKNSLKLVKLKCENK